MLIASLPTSKIDDDTFFASIFMFLCMQQVYPMDFIVVIALTPWAGVKLVRTTLSSLNVIYKIALGIMLLLH